MVEFERKKFNELINFHYKFQSNEPNIKCLGMRINTVSKMLRGINEGYAPFTFGKIYIPTTNEEKSNILSNELKIYL